MASPSETTVGPALKSILAIAYETRKPVLLEGPSGVGKSECVRAVAEKDLGIACIALDLSLLEPPDLIGLPVVANGRTSYAPPTTLPSDGAGILLLEELNRAERYIRQPVLQLLSARRLNEYVLPDGWSVVAAINPPDCEYDVEPLDTALLDRFLRLRVRADRDVWIDWAQSDGVHSAIIALAKLHDRLLSDVSPRAWKHASDLLNYFSDQTPPGDEIVRACLEGYLPGAWVTALLNTWSQCPSDGGLSAGKMLAKFGTDKGLRRQMADLRSRGRTDVLEQLTRQLIAILEHCDIRELGRTKHFSLKSFERIIEELPGDLAEQVQRAFGSNKTALSQLRLAASTVLKRYDTDQLSEVIEDWVSNPRKRHRAWALATGIIDFLDSHADLNRVRRNLQMRKNLGSFLRQLDFPHDRQFAKALESLGIKPIMPKRKR